MCSLFVLFLIQGLHAACKPRSAAPPACPWRPGACRRHSRSASLAMKLPHQMRPGNRYAWETGVSRTLGQMVRAKMALVAVCRRCKHRRVLYPANLVPLYGEDSRRLTSANACAAPAAVAAWRTCMSPRTKGIGSISSALPASARQSIAKGHLECRRRRCSSTRAFHPPAARKPGTRCGTLCNPASAAPSLPNYCQQPMAARSSDTGPAHSRIPP